jgi:hypothetical protein
MDIKIMDVYIIFWIILALLVGGWIFWIPKLWFFPSVIVLVYYFPNIFAMFYVALKTPKHLRSENDIAVLNTIAFFAIVFIWLVLLFGLPKVGF